MFYLKRTLKILFLLHVPLAFGWNAIGHRITAQIAFEHLTPEAKIRFSQYNHALDKVYPSLSFINAAVWLDVIKANDVGWFNQVHYINLYYSEDAMPLPPTPKWNVVSAIKESIRVLQSPKINNFDKGVALRVLMHLVGDVHQPMHAIQRVSTQYPDGDMGGLRFKLGKNSVGDNLHSYWDAGGGAFRGSFNVSQLLKKTSKIEENWPCGRVDTVPSHWAYESFQLAISAYKINAGDVPSKKYARMTQTISQQRIALAGCRLAAVLNQIDKKISQNKKIYSKLAS